MREVRVHEQVSKFSHLLVCLVLGHLQMNRWKHCCETVMQHWLGARWSLNIMSGSPEGRPDFRLQQYLVAVTPHCTCYSQIWIANSRLITMALAAPAYPGSSVYGPMKLSFLLIESEHAWKQQAHCLCKKICPFLSGAQAPQGLLEGLVRQRRRMGSGVIDWSFS